MNPNDHIGNEYDAMTGDQQERHEAANSRCSASACSLCRGLGTVDDETPWGVMQSPCPDCDSEENAEDRRK